MGNVRSVQQQQRHLPLPVQPPPRLQALHKLNIAEMQGKAAEMQFRFCNISNNYKGKAKQPKIKNIGYSKSVATQVAFFSSVLYKLYKPSSVDFFL